MPDAAYALTVVCLPNDTPAQDLTRHAVARLAAATGQRWTGAPAAHFTISTRLRRGKLVQPWQDTAAGGPVKLLALDAMRVAARNRFWYRWTIWSQVVAGTPTAQPFWTFWSRHLTNPGKYPLGTAQQQYLAQPRITAMRTYNALPNKVIDLPTGHLEAFQAGGHTYAHLGWLTAVPGTAFVGVDGTYLDASSDLLADRLTYLHASNRRIAQLRNGDYLVALLAH
ncbi:hypothetical protein AB0K00_53965 [Dactylosporangium sp. NPDC049525]|uniref:hypothetical protein n=1 Tax=Dactylosporangium sp. NPDC049525 TaxID=3154730 RepID=UPI00341F75AE